MKSLFKILFVSFIGLSIWADGEYNRNVSEYNLNSAGVGVIDVKTGKPFDPVAYFPEGGGVPAEGNQNISLIHNDVEYHFSTKANRELFKTNPSKYEPTYGGYCARAMVDGDKVAIDARLFQINGNRLNLFVSKRAQRSFERSTEANQAKADGHWERISGEKPRL